MTGRVFAAPAAGGSWKCRRGGGGQGRVCGRRAAVSTGGGCATRQDSRPEIHTGGRRAPLFETRAIIYQWTKRHISAIRSNHSSLVSSASFIIFRIIPFPIVSPGCIVIRVVRPSGCRMNRWLPFCLICRKPMFSNALITWLFGNSREIDLRD